MSYIVLGNAVVAGAVSSFHLFTRIFLGGLRQAETEAIGESIRWNVTETCIALTIFRSEVDVAMGGMFLMLVVGKCLHWAAELRGSNLRMTEEAFYFLDGDEVGVGVGVGHSKGSGVGMRMAHAFTVERRRDAHNIKRIVFGTAALSKSSDPSALLDAAYSKGYRRFDLAHTYGGGQSEILFGRWLESRSGTIDRGELNIITKGGIGDDAFGDPDRPLLTRRGLREEVDESLHALRVDRVDLYMYHRDDVRLSVEQFVDWINDVGVSTGKVERWGVSNWTFERFKAAHSYAKAKGLVPPSTNSPQYSLANPSDGEIWPSTYSISGQDKEEEIDWYQDRGVELLCWEVLAKGFMAKADLWPEHEVDPASLDAPVERGSDEWRLQRMQRAYCHAENYRRRHLAVRLADLTGVNLAQIAMLYPLTRGRHISVIFGSSKVDHLDDMVALQHMNIDDEAMMLLAGHREVMMTDADADADKEEEGFAFLPRMMGLGRNRIRPIQLTAKAREAKIAAEKKVAERMPVAFTATSTSSSARGIGRSS
uniref:NADP-dependent oxidoreductase domain-containing protein n=1 Tax=Odontella aurita TaxID=265563 RepID=A0A7S4IQS8_9STRA